MRRVLSLLAVLAVLAPAAAGAGPSKDDVNRARKERSRAIARARALAGEAQELTAEYRELGQVVGRSAARLIDAYRVELEAAERLTQAQLTLNRRANAAYRVGPGAFLTVFLESRSPAEFLASRELIERTIFSDIRTAATILNEAEHTTGVRADLERERAKLVEQNRKLDQLRDEIDANLVAAQAATRKAGVRLAKVQAARAAFLAEQAARASAINAIGVDQSELLALLGPSGGRSCTVPPKLRLTGNDIAGTASWYGDEFAGQPTATGAIFDPSLFTAAHKTLPLNSFVRVRWNGKCATVLVNDRGPFHGDWMLDLSQAAAAYLGYEHSGTARVQADLLARR